MRRAYPQFLAAGGEGLPAEILQVIFPLTYWDSIRQNATLHDLDPYVVAALIAQESTFDAGRAFGRQRVGPDADRSDHRPAAGARRSASGASRRRC